VTIKLVTLIERADTACAANKSNEPGSMALRRTDGGQEVRRLFDDVAAEAQDDADKRLERLSMRLGALAGLVLATLDEGS